jgi:DNA repair exonuclease SbcCD ATPase subunit
MNNLVTKLSSIAALLGVLGAIGAGFVQYGKLTAKIAELDKRKAVINQSVDLDPLHEKISALEVELIDRISTVEEKIQPQDMTWVLEAHIDIRENIAKIREEIAALDIPKPTNLKPLNEALKELEDKISELDTDVKIVQKENQLQDVLIEEIKAAANNPLAN